MFPFRTTDTTYPALQRKMVSKGLHRLMICIVLIFALAAAALRFADLSVIQSATLGDD
jgi:hypothetical protein